MEPAYTLSFRYIALPSFVFGSMPRTARSNIRGRLPPANNRRALLAKTTHVSAMLAVELLAFFPTGQLHALRIDDDDVVAEVEKGSVAWLVLTLEKLRGDGGNPSQHLRVGVNHIPGTLHIPLRWYERCHKKRLWRTVTSI